MSKEIKLEGQQWYRDRDGEIYFCVGKCQTNRPDCYLVHDWAGNPYNVYPNGRYIDAEERSNDLVEHLPDCDSFDWEPKPKLQLREGAWYERSDNKIVGPCKLLEHPNCFADDAFWQINGYWYRHDGTNLSQRKLIREVDPPKPTYRSFQNAEEFRLHWLRLLKYTGNKKNHYISVDAFNDECVFLSGDSDHHSYEYLLDNFVFADTGLPVGVEVME